MRFGALRDTRVTLIRLPGYYLRQPAKLQRRNGFRDIVVMSAPAFVIPIRSDRNAVFMGTSCIPKLKRSLRQQRDDFRRGIFTSELHAREYLLLKRWDRWLEGRIATRWRLRW